jgi:hypothetical protein
LIRNWRSSRAVYTVFCDDICFTAAALASLAPLRYPIFRVLYKGVVQNNKTHSQGI